MIDVDNNFTEAPDSPDTPRGTDQADPGTADFYRRFLLDPVFAAPPPVDPDAARERDGVRITGPGFSSPNGRDFAFNPPSSDQDDPATDDGATLPASAPFDLTLTQNTSGGGATVTLAPGCASNLVPGNLFEELAVPAAALSYVYVEIATDGQTPQNCQLKIATAAPAPNGPTINSLPGTARAILHVITYADGSAGAVYTPFRVFYPATNVLFTPTEAFRTSAANATPGVLPYDTWYYWKVTGTDGSGY